MATKKYEVSRFLVIGDLSVVPGDVVDLDEKVGDRLVEKDKAVEYKPPTSEDTADSLSRMTVAELREIAAALDIDHTGLRKAQLVDVLIDAGAEG